MAYFTPTTGVITNISNAAAGNTQTSGCTLLISIMSEDQGQISMVLPSYVYVLNSQQLQVGDRVTFFYDPQAPVPLIYPSQYRAVAAAATPYGTNAYLDVFDPMMTNTDHTLTLNVSDTTMVSLPNGQMFGGSLEDKLLLVIYGATTRSIPAQTTPEQIVVFCSE